MKPILVIGSLNMDLVVQAERAPAAGETLPARGFQTIPGGKGANQAVAAARFAVGAAGLPPSGVLRDVRMLGRVGADAFGEQLIAGLAAEGVDTRAIRRLEGVSSGVALIVVEQGGENRILIVAGANGRLLPEDVDGLESEIRQAGLVVMQFEVPLPTVERALARANAADVPVLLNPAPARPVSPEFLARADGLVLNEVEAAAFSGLPVSDAPSAQAAARRLLAGRTRLVVVTLGAKGALAVTPAESLSMPAFPVQVVDTTAAGDSFIGALAVSLVEGAPLAECLRRACAAGALAVTRLGAQSSIPTRAEVEAFLRPR